MQINQIIQLGQFYAVSILTGIGFTMSLFVGNLALVNNMQYIDDVKIVLAGSLLSTVFGYVLLLLFSKMISNEIIKFASNTSNVGLTNKYTFKSKKIQCAEILLRLN